MEVVIGCGDVQIVRIRGCLSNLLMTIFQTIYKNSVRTSQETHYVSATKPERLMLFRETVAL
jgi:hypothetical protein